MLQKKYVASSGLLRTFDMLFYDFQPINWQKFSLILFYSTLRPFFGYFYPSNECILKFYAANGELQINHSVMFYAVLIQASQHFIFVLMCNIIPNIRAMNYRKRAGGINRRRYNTFPLYPSGK